MAQWPQVDNDTLAAAYAPEYYGTTPKKFVGPIANFVGQFQNLRARQVAAEAARFGSEARVLDIGCGNGGFLMNLAGQGVRHLEGTELSAPSAQRVPRGANLTVHVGDLLDLDLPESTYSVITIWHVLEHLRDPQAALAKCHRLLAPGGMLFIAVPNQDSSQARRSGRHWFHLDPPRHLFGFGPRSLALLLRRTGFNLMEMGTFSLEQDPYGWIQSELNMLGFPRDRAYATLKQTGRHGKLERLTDLALVGMLTPYGLTAAVIAALGGGGGTLSIVAQKD